MADADLPLADPAKTWWAIRDLAVYFNLAPQTVRAYRTVPGKLPEEDDKIDGKPVWRPETVIGWTIPGPGRGYRSDLKDRDE